MDCNFIISVQKAKELLNKLLKENLEDNLEDLELNNLKEMASLSLIKDSSQDILKYLSQLSEKVVKDENIEFNNQSDINHNKIQYLNLEEPTIEIDSILKNKKYKNKRNKEYSESSIFFENKNTKTKVSFIDNSNKDSNITPEKLKKHKTFIKNYFYTSKKKEKNFIKRISTGKEKKFNKKIKDYTSKQKILTERSEKTNEPIASLTIREKNYNKFKIKNILLNKNSNNEEKKNKSKTFKKALKTSINFYSKNMKPFGNSFVNEFKIDESNYSDKKFKEDEKNLNYLCNSFLLDFNKDELLVNNSKININDCFSNDALSRKINFQNELDIKKNKNNENFKLCIQYFLKYLKIQDILNLCQTKKEILKIVINIKIKNTQKTIDEIKSILIAKKININDNSIPKNNKPFQLNSNSIKTISLLNSISKANFIKTFKNYKEQNNVNNKNYKYITKIILIFDLYFIALGNKKILNSLNDNNEKLEYISNYFKNNKNRAIGSIIENDLKGKKFDDFIIDSLYENSYKYLNIINPNYYKKINKDIAIFAFLIKNILDYTGISFINNNNKNHLNNNKNNEQKLALINKSRLRIKNIFLDKFNQILNKFN